MFVVAVVAHYYSAHAFGIRIPFGQLLTFLPVIFMVAALPVTVAHLGTTQAAWIFFFGAYAPAPRLLAFSLVAHLTFTLTRALLGLAWLPVAYADLTRGNQASARKRLRGIDARGAPRGIVRGERRRGEHEREAGAEGDQSPLARCQ